MEVRAVLEPGIAALAAQRRSQAHLEEMQAAIDEERRARSAEAAHDASRRFHLALARATGNDEFVRCIDGPLDRRGRPVGARAAGASRGAGSRWTRTSTPPWPPPWARAVAARRGA